MNGKLVEYIGSSSYEPDRTDFDDNRAADLVRGKTTRGEVLTLFGKPSGAAIYPMVSQRDSTALYYYFEEHNFGTHKRRVKILAIVFNNEGIVRDYYVSNEIQPLAAPSGLRQ